MHHTLIQIFAKPPQEGTVKTRLIPDIGVESATAIYRHCLKSNLNMLQQGGFEYQIWLTEHSDHALFAQQDIQLQQGTGIGERMYFALSTELDRKPSSYYQNVILIGSDCLDITAKILQRVIMKLQHHDVVFIPALDGGYVLVAARNEIDARLFQSIDWSTEKVLRQSLHIAMDQGISTAVLNPLRDIDRLQDVKHYAELTPLLNFNSSQ